MGSSKEELTGFFDQGVKITGELEFQNTLRVDGTFCGKIKSNDTLVVGDRGLVDGEIEVGIVTVNGTVKGKVRAKVRLEIQKGGRVFADVTTPSLLVVEGGLLQGNCEMDLRGKVQDTQVVLEWKSRK